MGDYNTFLSRKVLDKTIKLYLKVSYKGIALLVHLESNVMLLIGVESENIQEQLLGGFLGTLNVRAQSVVATANRKTLFPWNKSIVQSLLLFFSHTHDSAKKESIQFIYNQGYTDIANSDPNASCKFSLLRVIANSYTQDYLRIWILRSLRIRVLCRTANLDTTGNLQIRVLRQTANSDTNGILQIRIMKTPFEFVDN
ncbi:hypothetical protein Tco_1143763 [Tanacetum coccineum]